VRVSGARSGARQRNVKGEARGVRARRAGLNGATVPGGQLYGTAAPEAKIATHSRNVGHAGDLYRAIVRIVAALNALAPLGVCLGGDRDHLAAVGEPTGAGAIFVSQLF
jgi:hypothetical protein